MHLLWLTGWYFPCKLNKFVRKMPLWAGKQSWVFLFAHEKLAKYTCQTTYSAFDSFFSVAVSWFGWLESEETKQSGNLAAYSFNKMDLKSETNVHNQLCAAQCWRIVFHSSVVNCHKSSNMAALDTHHPMCSQIGWEHIRVVAMTAGRTFCPLPS